jgi:hypothetical protein
VVDAVEPGFKGTPDAPKVLPQGYLALILTGLGSLGFPSAAVFMTFFTKWEPFFKKAADTLFPGHSAQTQMVLDVAAVAGYAQNYLDAKLPEERMSIRNAARVRIDSEFESWFPLDHGPTITGPVTGGSR